MYDERKDVKNPAKAKMGKAATMDAKENETVHVQRLKSVKLYNNPMDETTSAEMKIKDEDPKGKPTGVAPPQQPKASAQRGLQRNCQAAQRSHLKL